MFRPLNVLCLLLLGLITGCGQEIQSYPLDKDLARASVTKAMQAWVDGKQPKDLQPELVVGDSTWEQGRKLVSFEVLNSEETSDGSNLHIRVMRKFEGGGKGPAESKIVYIVGTSPVVTIFPQ